MLCGAQNIVALEDMDSIGVLKGEIVCRFGNEIRSLYHPKVPHFHPTPMFLTAVLRMQAAGLQCEQTTHTD